MLGFSSNEIDVYLALLGKKSATGGEIIKQTGFHRNVVYTSLNHLINKKVVCEKSKNKKKYFVPETLDYLEQSISEQVEICKIANNEIKNNLSEDNNSITVYEGNDEFLRLLLSLLNKLDIGGRKYILGAGGEEFMEETMRSIWKKYHKKAEERKIKINMIAYENQKDALLKDIEKNKSLYEIKFLQGQDKNPSGIQIYPQLNTVVNIIYSDSKTNVTAIKIVSSKLTQGYLNLFNSLWSEK